jgi:hypothetical protein
MGFATQYRVSVGYDVSVTLIDSTQPVKAALPVLGRNSQDKGWQSQANLNPPFPTLNSVTTPNQQTSARLGDTLTLIGVNLGGTNVGVQFNHPLWTAPVEVAPTAGGTSSQLSVQIPKSPTVWPAGFYTLAVLVQRPGETYRRTTNQLALSLAPSVTITPASAPAGSVTYTATCTPQIWLGQAVSLFLGDAEIAAQAFTAQTGTLTFAATDLAAGSYYFRLRVDGVDSLLVNRSVTPPVFDATQQVTIT